ncbi:hypothetical protein B296_00041922 [Ensete ventricosum]|uniref:Uncharacterized protein n=1 Tax=Ensete ventricosum TaxID=4639 RepID=A0A426ZHI8_ENSVE|nr:hypothetical protein B296_00041922 [Ensete ventricosum]
MAERDYALEMWRLLDPDAHLISTKQLVDRVVCVKSGKNFHVDLNSVWYLVLMLKDNILSHICNSWMPLLYLFNLVLNSLLCVLFLMDVCSVFISVGDSLTSTRHAYSNSHGVVFLVLRNWASDFLNMDVVLWMDPKFLIKIMY